MQKKYDQEKAMNAGLLERPAPDQQGQAPANQDDTYAGFIESLPEEFQAEIEESLTALLSYIHSDEGLQNVIERVKTADNIGAAIGQATMQAMDAADPNHEWSDSAKALAGFFGVKEVSNILREGGVIDLPERKEAEIYEVATKNYIESAIRSKPTQEEREAEAVRWQKEVDPLVQGETREMMLNAGKQGGHTQ